MVFAAIQQRKDDLRLIAADVKVFIILPVAYPESVVCRLALMKCPYPLQGILIKHLEVPATSIWTAELGVFPVSEQGKIKTLYCLVVFSI